MSNYNKSTNFAVKDTLTSGDPDKVVSGAEIDNEFNDIASAVSSKADKVAAATTDNFAALNANGNLKDSGENAKSILPSGLIVLWSGALLDVPIGWQICDGTNNTPDLRDRFVVGAGGAYAPDNTGGADSVTLTENQIPSHSHGMSSDGNHSHSGSTSTDGSHVHSFSRRGDDGQDRGAGYSVVGYDNNIGGGDGDMNAAGSHNHSLSINDSGSHTHNIYNTGGGESHENRPPYYALAYIMKL